WTIVECLTERPSAAAISPGMFEGLARWHQASDGCYNAVSRILVDRGASSSRRTRDTHAPPRSDTGARQRPQIATFQFARIDVALHPQAHGMHERGDVVDSESVDIAKPSPAVREPASAVAAVVAIDERSRHVIEQDGAARAT